MREVLSWSFEPTKFNQGVTIQAVDVTIIPMPCWTNKQTWSSHPLLDFRLYAAFSTIFGCLVIEPSYWFVYLMVTWLALDKSLVDVKFFGYWSRPLFCRLQINDLCRCRLHVSGRLLTVDVYATYETYMHQPWITSG